MTEKAMNSVYEDLPQKSKRQQGFINKWDRKNENFHKIITNS